MTQTNFLQKLDQIKEEVILANESFEGYRAVYNRSAIDNEIMNCTPGIFHLFLYHSLISFSLILARLFDNDSKAITLRKLQNNLEQNYRSYKLSAEATKQAIKQIDSYFAKEQKTIDKLKYLRDKGLAHNDPKTTPSEMWIYAGITAGEFESLLKSAYEITCIFLVLFDRPIPPRVIGIETDLDTIIDALRTYYSE